MRKKFTVFMALIIAFFTVPFGGLTALANGKVYNDIEDGDYTIGVKAIEENSDKESAADGFLQDKATLSIKGDDITLKFGYKKADGAMGYTIDWTKLEGENPVTDDEDNLADYYTFKVDELRSIYGASMNYKVPTLGMDHDVDYRIVLDENDLNNLPEKSDEEEIEKEEPEPAPEEREVGELITENEADAVYKLEYKTDSPATQSNLLNPVKLLEQDGKKYIQIPINERGANYFRSLEINGKQVTWNSITEGPYTIQFELPGNIEDTLTLDMVIQAGPNAMPHNGIEVWFNTDTIETIKEPKEPEVPKQAPEERVVDTQIKESEADAVYELEYETDSPATRGNLLNPVKLLEQNGKKYIQIPINERGANYFRSLEINDKQVIWNSITEGPYTIQFELPGNIEDTLTLDMVIQAGPNAMSHDGIEVWFNTDAIETIKEPKKEPAKEKYEEVNYVVKHATEDEISAADSFFTKPAHLIERDGETYIQLTIKSWSMIDWLRTEHSDVTIIEKNDDTAIVEFKVAGELSDAINLSMQVTVPGLYEMEHEARLFLDVNEDNNSDDEEIETDDEEKENGAEEKENNKSTPGEKTEIVPEKAYEINYVVKHATEDRTSAADSFFVKPAFLLYDENGEKYIQLIIKDWDMINWLRTEHGDVIVVEENDDGSVLIQFKVAGDLADEILLSMSVTVPGLYSMEHEARLIFDVDSQDEVDPSDYKIINDSAGSKGPEKPEFGNGEGNEDNDDEDTVTPGNKNNPQTGDTTNILLYSMLLIGSLIPLAVKLRRRFV